MICILRAGWLVFWRMYWMGLVDMSNGTYDELTIYVKCNCDL